MLAVIMVAAFAIIIGMRVIRIVIGDDLGRCWHYEREEHTASDLDRQHIDCVDVSSLLVKCGWGWGWGWGWVLLFVSRSLRIATIVYHHIDQYLCIKSIASSHQVYLQNKSIAFP